MGFYDNMAERLLGLLGVDLDFEIDLHGDAFNLVSHGLLVGRRPRPDSVKALQDAGVTHVVSCLEGHLRDDMRFLEHHFDSLFIELRDGIDQDITATFGEFFAFAPSARDARVLVHCQAGVSRSATLAIAQVMRSADRTFYDAFCEVRRGRPEVLPNIGFASQLQQFEWSLAGDAPPSQPSSLARYLHEFCNVPSSAESIEQALRHNGHDAASALLEMFDGEIPRVVQGVRL